MADATARFFRDLEERERFPELSNANGVVRFEIKDGDRTEQWVLAIRKGDVSVARGGEAADCVVIADRPLFDAIASGEKNAMAAVLRGALRIEGDPTVLVAFQRLLPGPPRSAR